jgi:hypothetical protein
MDTVFRILQTVEINKNSSKLREIVSELMKGDSINIAMINLLIRKDFRVTLNNLKKLISFGSSVALQWLFTQPAEKLKQVARDSGIDCDKLYPEIHKFAMNNDKEFMIGAIGNVSTLKLLGKQIKFDQLESVQQLFENGLAQFSKFNCISNSRVFYFALNRADKFRNARIREFLINWNRGEGLNAAGEREVIELNPLEIGEVSKIRAGEVGLREPSSRASRSVSFRDSRTFSPAVDVPASSSRRSSIRRVEIEMPDDFEEGEIDIPTIDILAEEY